MRHLSKPALAGVTILASTVLGFVAFALPASASVATDPTSVSATALPTPIAGGTVTPPESGTTEAAKRKKPCTGGAVLDSETGKWRAAVSCDNWTAVLPGSYETRQEAQDQGEATARDLNGVMDGPGCDPPLILC